MNKRTRLSLLMTLIACGLSAQPIAFPGAEGYGKFARGGRGGAVYEVTNLRDGGEGSLRAAVEAEGPRTVVFRISGTIALESPLRIQHPYLTIAGQTAPGDGICIKGHPLLIGADHVIIRYLRTRLGDETGSEADALSGRFVKHVIIDHVSASWSVDETMSIYHCDSITVQWCLNAESLYNSNHFKGNHGYGAIWGGNHSTYHHNLLAHHGSRNPRFSSGSEFTDYRNNVVYNWGYNSCYGGEALERHNERFRFSTINMVANYYKPGPATRPGPVSYRIAGPSSRDEAADYGQWYIAGNVVEGHPTVTADNWDGGVQPRHGESFLDVIRLPEPWPAMPIQQESAEAAFESVLQKAGATLPRRDTLDARYVAEVRGGYATYGGATYASDAAWVDADRPSGIIDSQAEVGGWPVLQSLPAPTDTDHDGMPDAWEEDHGLDKDNPEDRNLVGEEGYTMLEHYLNGIQ